MLNAQETEWLSRFIEDGFKEDVGQGDHTSLACIPPDARNTARLLVKDHGILAGVDVAKAILLAADPACTINQYQEDGARVKPGETAFEVEGNTQALLQAERLLLNTMQRMSGIATETRKYCDEVAGLPVRILDTRKTTPLLRFLEKWAVRIGGGENYRSGLYDWFMIKDNHIDACGGIRKAIERIAAYQQAKGLSLNVTVEVRNLEELSEVLDTGNVTRIMFDNFNPASLREAVKRTGKRFETEASGGITLNTLREYAATGVDFISIGALTHSFKSLDLSFKMKR
ncbi:MAG: putative nicotinate-nucleotide pyrophosphorylase [carboxylating] [Haliscomenobacter sp.]|jgi:nicotinate-nucleotide pyrophosphorylase (carboxylating)|nr:putative nicotinate-nucleotide pyrophosphorylase [carboxylating] [Haliscomenobacter sp.]